MRLEQSDDGVYLSAAVQFELPSLVEEVLDKGIAIYFVAEAEMYQERWYWTDRKVAQVTRHMRLAYQPLTRRWRLNVSPVPITGAAGFGVSLNQNFDSLADALEAVKRVGRLRHGRCGRRSATTRCTRSRSASASTPRSCRGRSRSAWSARPTGTSRAERSARCAVEKQR